MKADEITLPCGCVESGEIGITLKHCEAHDPRTPRLRTAAALQQMGAELDEAGRLLEATEHDRAVEAGSALRRAAKAAVAAAKAVLGPSDRRKP